MLRRPDKPDFERFCTALRGGCPDRVPIAEALIANSTKAAILGRPIRRVADDVAFWIKAGYDYACLPSGILKLGATIDADVRAQTRSGSYEQEEKVTWAQESSGLIASMVDVEAYPWPRIQDLVPPSLEEAAQALPPGMKVIATTGKIFTAAWQLMGFEKFCLAVYDEPDVVEALFQRIEHLQIASFERVCSMDAVGGFWFSDDVAYSEGLLVSPVLLRRFVFPAYARMVEMAHQAGKVAIFHSDGQLWDLLDDIIDCGFDALHPIEPKAMDIHAVRQLVRDRLSLIGNVNLDYPLATGTPAAVREEVRELIAALAPDGGYIVGSSNSIPPWIPVENYVAMIQATFDFGRYPVSI